MLARGGALSLLGFARVRVGGRHDGVAHVPDEDLCRVQVLAERHLGRREGCEDQGHHDEHEDEERMGEREASRASTGVARGLPRQPLASRHGVGVAFRHEVRVKCASMNILSRVASRG